MNTPILTTRNLSLAAAAALAFALWQADQHFATIIVALVATGIAMARPTIRDRKLRLDGTPVLLMFAVMFVAASGMVTAVDRVGALFETETTTECGEEWQAAVQVVGELRD